MQLRGSRQMLIVAAFALIVYAPGCSGGGDEGTGGSGGNGGNATGPNSHGGDGGDGGNGGTCNETGGTSNLSSGVVAGIVIGALAGICTIIGGGYKFLKWAKKNPQHKAST